MNKRILILAVGTVGLMCGSAVIAQTGQQDATEDGSQALPPPRFEEETIPEHGQTGLHVEERRFENRLDGVTVEHRDSRVREYYNLNDPDVERRDGGIVESGAMRTWRLGVGKKQ